MTLFIYCTEPKSIYANSDESKANNNLIRKRTKNVIVSIY